MYTHGVHEVGRENCLLTPKGETGIAIIVVARTCSAFADARVRNSCSTATAAIVCAWRIGTEGITTMATAPANVRIAIIDFLTKISKCRWQRLQAANVTRVKRLGEDFGFNCSRQWRQNEDKRTKKDSFIVEGVLF